MGEPIGENTFWGADKPADWDPPPNDWVSLVNILEPAVGNERVPVAKLATSIETTGIYVIDRFGRQDLATEGERDEPTSKYFALDLVAFHSKYRHDPELVENDRLYESLDTFGWPKDKAHLANNVAGSSSEPVEVDTGYIAHGRWSQEMQNEDERIGKAHRDIGQTAA